MENQILNIVAGGVLCWTTAFLIAKKTFPKRSLEFCNRLVSTTHAALAVTLATLSVEDWTRPVSPLASNSSPYQCGTEMVTALWVTEISSPFLHLRELLKEIGYRDTQLNFAADVSSQFDTDSHLVSSVQFYLSSFDCKHMNMMLWNLENRLVLLRFSH
ncbi:hypothetical protein LINPERPRIM_LOCUS32687 [Linum perenne]